MANLKIPVTEIEGNKYHLKVDTSIYDKDAVNAAAYKFTGRFYIHQQTNKTNPTYIDIIFESKDGLSVKESDIKAFYNELIDQQLRIVVNSKFGKIRDLIVEEAFKPVNK